MTAELFLGIDAGTSGVRACAINRMEEVAGINNVELHIGRQPKVLGRPEMRREGHAVGDGEPARDIQHAVRQIGRGHDSTE